MALLAGEMSLWAAACVAKCAWHAGGMCIPHATIAYLHQLAVHCMHACSWQPFWPHAGLRVQLCGTRSERCATTLMCGKREKREGLWDCVPCAMMSLDQIKLASADQLMYCAGTCNGRAVHLEAFACVLQPHKQAAESLELAATHSNAQHSNTHTEGCSAQQRTGTLYAAHAVGGVPVAGAAAAIVNL